jgi:hypothetical protein
MGAVTALTCIGRQEVFERAALLTPAGVTA